ncbi:uncharacterized protein LOC117642113 isoform X1 [Thrips palmi]|uniref:Uncharacterized protein LOC117642113 isoform X1 n=1 Tax=Thrips palmi TaxID=161013 RepID=A0A6P8YH16_THRPL|nr:uncharacterized protein LOC117642113 isoform X1 [Thrips palmi]
MHKKKGNKYHVVLQRRLRKKPKLQASGGRRRSRGPNEDEGRRGRFVEARQRAARSALQHAAAEKDGALRTWIGEKFADVLKRVTSVGRRRLIRWVDAISQPKRGACAILYVKRETCLKLRNKLCNNFNQKLSFISNWSVDRAL